MSKTQKANTNLSKEELSKLSELSDEKSTKTAPKFPLPSLKVNGKSGGYNRTVLDKNGDLKTGEDGKAVLEEVKDPKGVILRVRKSFQHIGGDFQLFSTEGGNTPKSQFTVFEKREGKKGDIIQAVFSGTPAEIKAKFPEIKMIQVIYFLLNGAELVRLKVKGLSLGNLFDYFKEFDSTEHTFEYETILGEKKGKNKFGSFITATFERGDKVKDFTEVKKNMQLIADKIAEIETYQAERQAEAEAVSDMSDAPARRERSPEMEEALEAAKNFKKEEEEYNEKHAGDPKGEDEEEIDVSKIPFGN